MRGEGIFKAIPWLENPRDMDTTDKEVYDPEQRIEDLSTMEDPRVFKMHVERQDVPRPEGHNSKIIVITRDPRDVPYSFYEHMRIMEDEEDVHTFLPKGLDTTFEEFFYPFVDEHFFHIPFLKSFWPHRHDPNLLWLRYEDMKKDTRACADKIVSFLQWDVSSQVIDQAIQLSEFRHMQKVERTVLYTKNRRLFRKNSSFIREGCVGKNRKKMTKDMEDYLMALLTKELDPELLEFLLPKPKETENSPEN